MERAHESLALDGLEFLRGTGVWLCEYFWGIDPRETRRAMLTLAARNRDLRKRIDEARNALDS